MSRFYRRRASMKRLPKTIIVLALTAMTALGHGRMLWASTFYPQRDAILQRTDQQRFLDQKRHITATQHTSALIPYPQYLKYLVRRVFRQLSDAMAHNRQRLRDNRRLRDRVKARIKRVREQTRTLRHQQQRLLMNRQDQGRSIRDRMATMAFQRRMMMESQRQHLGLR